MISPYRRLSLAVAAAVLHLATAAAAQTSDASQIQKRLKAGDTIFIVNVDGSEMRGRVERISEGTLEFRLITPGATPNEYRMENGLTSVPLEQIAALNLADAIGPRREPVYERGDSFGSLPDRLKPGQVVHVIERSGVETVGKVAEVSTSALVLTIRHANPRDGSGRPRYEWSGSKAFAPSLVEKIERPAHIWDGALKGAAVAALATFLVIRSSCRYCDGTGSAYPLTVAIGAGIGLGIDAAFPPRRVYRAPT